MGLKLNQPIQGALAFAKAKRGASKIAGKCDWFMYTLVSGDKLFIDFDDCENPDEMFQQLNIGAGDPFMLTLRKTSSGGRYLEVKKHGAAAPVSQADRDSLQLQAALNASIALANQQRKPAVTPQCAPVPVPAAINTPNAPHTNPIALVPERPRAGSLMASALVAAVDAVIIARDYAEAKGLAITFCAEDLRCIAATLYIQHHKEPQYAQRAGGRP